MAEVEVTRAVPLEPFQDSPPDLPACPYKVGTGRWYCWVYLSKRRDDAVAALARFGRAKVFKDDPFVVKSKEHWQSIRAAMEYALAHLKFANDNDPHLGSKRQARRRKAKQE